MSARRPGTRRCGSSVGRVRDGEDRAREVVDVFNFDGAGTPVTELMVCNVVKGKLVRAGLKVISM